MEHYHHRKLGSLLLQKLNGNSFLDYFPPNPQIHTLSIYTAAKRTLYYLEDCSCIYLPFIQYIVVAGLIVITMYNICYIWAVLPQPLQVRKCPWYRSSLSLATRCQYTCFPYDRTCVALSKVLNKSVSCKTYFIYER